MDYVNKLRLEKARKMLDECPELTIENISQQCGFAYSTLYRLFKEHYKLNPAEYRKVKETFYKKG